MNKQQLNALAVTAKNDEVAAWEIKAHYMPLIEKLQEENWHKMNNEGAFLDDAYRRINYAIKSYEPSKGDFNSRATTLIYQGLKEHCGRRGKRRDGLISIEGEAEDRNHDEAKYGMQFRDESVNVEEQALEEVQKDELLTKYATSDMDKLIIEIILDAEELLTQSEITRRLAERTGRTFNSARGVVRSFCDKKKKGAALAC